MALGNLQMVADLQTADQTTGILRTKNLQTVAADQWVVCGPQNADHSGV